MAGAATLGGRRALLALLSLALACASGAWAAESPPPPAPPPATRYQGPLPRLQDIFRDVGNLSAMCPPARSHAVVASASYEDPTRIHHFIRSWQTHMPRTVMVLISARDGLKVVHDQGRINVVLIRETLGFDDASSPTYRIFYIHLFLDHCKSRGLVPQALMLSDARDAVALGNIWEHPQTLYALQHNMVIAPLEGDIADGGVAMEAPNGDFPHLVKLLRICLEPLYSEEIIDLINKAPMACSGAMWGRGLAMMEYAKAMHDLFLYNVTGPCWRTWEQGIHNFLVHYVDRVLHALSFKFLTPTNGYGPLFTAGLAKRDVRVSKFGVVSVHRGDWVHYPLMVHQIDRNDTAFTRLKELYHARVTG